MMTAQITAIQTRRSVKRAQTRPALPARNQASPRPTAAPIADQDRTRKAQSNRDPAASVDHDQDDATHGDDRRREQDRRRALGSPSRFGSKTDT